MLESLRATKVGDLKGIERTVLRQKKIHILIVKTDGAGEERQPEIFVLDGIASRRDGIDRLGKLAFRQDELAASGMGLRKPCLGFPTNGGGRSGIRDYLHVRGFRLGEATGISREVRGDQTGIELARMVGCGSLAAERVVDIFPRGIELLASKRDQGEILQTINGDIAVVQGIG